MIRRLRVERFKSLASLELELGAFNVFIGANGSGKSNLLEAVGVLGAAAGGRVDDEALQHRGVRPGLPALYQSAFPFTKVVPHILFGAVSERDASYDVTLWRPKKDPDPAWKFKSESLTRDVHAKKKIASRNPTQAIEHNQEQGLAALKAFELKREDPARVLLDDLRTYAVYCPNTPTLRGLVQDPQTRSPVGLAGGRLPEAVQELQAYATRSKGTASELEKLEGLLDWASEFGAASAGSVPLSPSASRSRLVIEFVDRFMRSGSNRLTGYDASEGALYALYYAVLALHPRAPRCLAVDNLDQALNPRLAQRLVETLVSWVRNAPGRQWLLTAHNPAVLDGLPLADSEVRLFAVDRDSEGHTVVTPIDAKSALAKRPDRGWTLSRMWMAGLLGGVPQL